MKLTKGKINKIKGKRNQSKKRLGHKHKHLVKHGRDLSYRKKRHFNLKNQTLKRFGIEVGGNSVVSKDANDVNNSNSNNNDNNLSSNATNATNVDTKKKDKASKTITSFFKNWSFNKKNSDSTNATKTNLPVATTDASKSATTTTPSVSNDVSSKSATITVPVESNSTTTKNINNTNLPVATIVEPIPAATNVENASKSTTTTTTIPPNKDVSKSSNLGNIQRDPTEIQRVPIKSMAPAPKKAVTTISPTTTTPVTRPVTTPSSPTTTTPVTTPSSPTTTNSTTINAPTSTPSDEKNKLSQATCPQFVNLPDHFGPSTTMAELANYFSNVFLVQLMSKFDINTSMTLRDILLNMNKVNNNMGNNMELNSNGIGSGSGIGNANGARSVGMMNNANPYSITSQDLQKNLNINNDPGINNNGNAGQNQYGNNNENANENANGYGDNNMNPNMGMGMGPMGMGGPMNTDHQQNRDIDNMPMSNMPIKDDRESHDIQYENEDLSAKNTELSEKHDALNQEKTNLTNDTNANNNEIEKLKKQLNEPNVNKDEIQKSIDELNEKNATNKNTIREKESNMRSLKNEMAGNESKIKSNTKEINSRKSWGQYFSEKGSSVSKGASAIKGVVSSVVSPPVKSVEDLDEEKNNLESKKGEISERKTAAEQELKDLEVKRKSGEIINPSKYNEVLDKLNQAKKDEAKNIRDINTNASLTKLKNDTITKLLNKNTISNEEVDNLNRFNELKTAITNESNDEKRKSLLAQQKELKNSSDSLKNKFDSIAKTFNNKDVIDKLKTGNLTDEDRGKINEHFLNNNKYTLENSEHAKGAFEEHLKNYNSSMLSRPKWRQILRRGGKKTQKHKK
jgi:hypothetical protein